MAAKWLNPKHSTFDVEEHLSRILRFYVIREVALPTLLTLLTIIFVLLMGQFYRLITFLMQPSVSLMQVADALMSFIPSLLVLAIPMALLIGVLIGVGRMTLDREMLAAKASGINLFPIFFPMIILGLLVSLGIMWANYRAIPRLTQRGLDGIRNMQLALITSLEPAQFHGPKEMGDAASDFEFYFRERAADHAGLMKGILLKLESATDAGKAEEKADKARERAVKELEKAKKKGQAVDAAVAAAAAGSPLDGIVSSATLQQAGSAAGQPAVPAKAGVPANLRRKELTLITAESGEIAEIATTPTDDEDLKNAKQRTEIVMRLNHGAIHRLSPDPNDNQYMVIGFDKLEKRLVSTNKLEDSHKTKSNRELSKILNDKKSKKDIRGAARRELTQRYAISLASFVFVLIGIPLAIWVRPSGKSWGILLAVGLMLVYFVLMNTGLGMVKYGKPLGYIVTFSPTLLFLILGAGLWWQSVRS